MKLRTRLFVWVGSLFFIAFVVSYVLEGRLVRTNLEKSKANIRSQILTINEKKRHDIEKYLAASLVETEAQIDSLLAKLSEYPILRAGFSPNQMNIDYGTWLHCATTMANNKWIEYVLNTVDGKLGAQIVFQDQDKTKIKVKKVSDNFGLAIVTDDGKSNLAGPFVAIRFYVDEYVLNRPITAKEAAKFKDELPALWLLFKIDTIKDFPVNEPFPVQHWEDLPLVPFWHWPGKIAREALFQGFIEEIKEAQTYIRQNPSLLSNPTEWAQRLYGEGIHLDVHHPSRFASTSGDVNDETIEENIERRFSEVSHRLDELTFIWGLSAIYSLGPFGYSPDDARSPYGMGRTQPGTDSGNGLIASKCFFTTPFYEPRDCNGDKKEIVKLCSEKMLKTIPIPSLDKFYFGNTARFIDKEGKEGYLTFGRDGSEMLENLALITHQYALFVSDEKALMIYDPNGQEVTGSDWSQIPVKQIIDKESGIIKVGGVEYFFLHMNPFKSADLHFYIFNTKEKAFALVDALDKSANELIIKISWNMRIIAGVAVILALLLLSRIARRITKPIALLADAAERVGKGELEDLELPKIKESRRDEVYALYHAFNEMVQGLIEKERVRGVLNKVVSSDIAEEILKGNIHLGGEEKVVTVLFADIRHFTKLTEKMPPSDVVAMLNACMTKISRLIDDHGGVIDKYVGDEVMALFGAPVEKGDSAYQAVLAALGMVDALKSWNHERETQGLAPIEMGIGIHTGPMLAGNMGAENRLNYTVLGSNVNLASRLCSAAGCMEILISRSTYDAPGVKDHVTAEETPPLELKGFTEAVSVYKVTGVK